MIPMMMPMLLGAGLGAFTSKKPLQGALLGAGLGAVGGTLAGGGGLIPTGSGMGSAAETAGLLAPGASSAAGSQAAMLAAQNEGFGAAGQEMLAQAAGTKVPSSFGLMSDPKTLSGYLKPASEAMMTAAATKNLFAKDQMPVAQSTLPQRMPMDVSGLLNGGQLAQLNQKRMARRGLA